MKQVINELYALRDVPAIDKARAEQDFKRAKAADRKRSLYAWTAPFVVPVALLFTKRGDNRLPPWFSKWDNEVSLNGDGYGWCAEDGGPLVDTRDEEPLPTAVLISHQHPSYDGIPYYVPEWLHWLPLRWVQPRGFVARYVWIGLRNRASQLAVDLGRDVPGPVEIISGTADIGRRDNPGHYLMRSGDLYHFKSYTKWEPVGFLKKLGRAGEKVSRRLTFAVRRSYGHKLDIALYSPQTYTHAAAVAIGWSAKGWKFKD